MVKKEANTTDPEIGLWFKFFDGDTGSTTIDEIERNLKLPTSHDNHMYMLEMLEMTTELKNEMKIYLS